MVGCDVNFLGCGVVYASKNNRRIFPFRKRLMRFERYVPVV